MKLQSDFRSVFSNAKFVLLKAASWKWAMERHQKWSQEKNWEFDFFNRTKQIICRDIVAMFFLDKFWVFCCVELLWVCGGFSSVFDTELS